MVPPAPSLCDNSMPPRITRKSRRPRASDRTMVDTVQPERLLSFANRLASSHYRKPCRRRRGEVRSTAERVVRRTGLEVKELSSGHGRSVSLDIPLYRTAHYTSNPAPPDYLCKGEWLLKNSFRRASGKNRRARKPYKRLSRNWDTFTLIRNHQLRSFSTPTRFRISPPALPPRSACDELWSVRS